MDLSPAAAPPAESEFAGPEAVPPRARPAIHLAAPEKPRRTRVFAYFQLLALTAAAVLAYQADFGQLAPGLPRWLFTAGTVSAGLVFSTLLLVWSPRTQRWIPAGTLVLMLGGYALLGKVASAERAAAEEDLRVIRAMVAGEAPPPAPERIPLSEQGKLMRMLRLTFADEWGFHRNVGAVYKVDVDKAPDGWLSARYMAEPASYPQVAGYLAGFRKYVRAVRRSHPAFFRESMEKNLRAVGYEGDLLARMLKEAEAGYQERGMGRQRVFDAMERMVETGIVLDDYLRRIDAHSTFRSDPAGGTALFAGSGQAEEVERLRLAVAAGGERVERVQRQVTDDATGLISKLAKIE